MKRSLAALIVAAMALGLAQCFQEGSPKEVFDSPHSRKLDRKAFRDVIKDGNAHFIEFYSEDCRGCQKFAPDWTMIAEKFKDKKGVVLSQVNCSVEGLLCKQQAITSFPTINVYHNGEKFITYNGVLFWELVEMFIQSVSKDLLKETEEKSTQETEAEVQEPVSASEEGEL